MNRLYAILFCFGPVLTLQSCKTGPYTGVAADISGISEDQTFIADLLDSRIRERCSSAVAGGRTYQVRFIYDETISGEDAVVDVRRNGAEIRAGRTRSLIYGCGEFLRSLDYGARGFKVRPAHLEFRPYSSYRCCYMARHYNTWYQRAPKEELLRYIDDMFLWGINTLYTQLTMSTVNYAYSTPEERIVFDETTDAICSRVKQCDMSLQTSGGGNTARDGFPPEFKAEKLVPARGNDKWNVCPSKPGALEFLLKNREENLKKYVAKGYPITNMSYFPYDEGGCQCKDCAPWGGNGYVRTIEAMHRLNEKYFPGVAETVSTWFFDDKDYEGLFKYLETQDWIDYLEIDSHSDFPRYPLSNPIPGEIPVTTFPEITMWGRVPWGGYGATPLPERFEGLFLQVRDKVKGYRLYSEGLYDDINKITVTGLYTNPSLCRKKILMTYAGYELPGANPNDFVRLTELLEAMHPTGDPSGVKRRDFNFLVFLRDASPELLEERQRQSEKALALAEKIDREILPSMKNKWRWRLLYLRAVIDNQIYTSRKLHTETADDCYREIVRIYHGEAQLRRLLEEKKDGYTIPPYIPEVQMPAPKGSGIYDTNK
ncbi:MAG: hypothetical protein IJQ93_00665 [Bacteroidales bacterium]|nr:hypothetical protein [Bacteroidales bacterium]